MEEIRLTSWRVDSPVDELIHQLTSWFTSWRVDMVCHPIFNIDFTHPRWVSNRRISEPNQAVLHLNTSRGCFRKAVSMPLKKSPSAHVHSTGYCYPLRLLTKNPRKALSHPNFFPAFRHVLKGINEKILRPQVGMYIWVFPKIGVFPKHPKMIIFSRKTHGCWGNPPFLETSIS